MGIFTQKWKILKKNGNLYSKMEFFTPNWKFLHKNESIYSKTKIFNQKFGVYSLSCNMALIYDLFP